MSKQILLISSSPRKNANSDMLCDEFMKGARKSGHKAEKVRLAESDINYCTGCCACIGNPGSCVQGDDMNGLLQKVLEADVLVFASPVYFHSFNGHMKTFMDRVCPIYPLIHDKDVYFMVAAAGGNLPVGNAFKTFRIFTDCLDVTEKGTLAVTGVWGEGGVKGKSVCKDAYAMGQAV